MKPVSIARWRTRRRKPDHLRIPRPKRIKVHPRSLLLLNRFVRELNMSQDDVVWEALCVLRGELEWQNMKIAQSHRLPRYRL